LVHSSWRGPVAAALLAAAGTAGAAEGEADTAPPESPSVSGAGSPASPAPSVSPEELRRIQESLGADAARPAAAAPTPAGPAPASSSGGLMNPDLALILDTAGAYFSVPHPLQLGDHDPAGTGFALQQLEMALGANADPYLRFDGNLVFNEEGVEVEEAYATTLALPANLQLRAGKFLTRFGRINPTHPHAWQFVDQPLVIGKFFGGEGSRGIGLEGSWLAPLPWYVELSAAATGAAGEGNARSFYGAADPAVRNYADLLTTLALKQFFPLGEDLGLSWGLSAQLGPNPAGRTTVVGTDLYLRYRPVASTARAALSLQAEGLVRSRELPGRTLDDAGAYAQLVWDVDPRWETGVRYEYVEGVSGDPLDPAWTSGRRRAAAQVTYLPSHFTRIRLQANRDEPTFRNEDIWSAFLQLELAVGAHGSHTY
jgi:hypothetical protein